MNGKIIQIQVESNNSLLLLTDKGIVYRAIEDDDKYIVKEIKFYDRITTKKKDGPNEGR